MERKPGKSVFESKQVADAAAHQTPHAENAGAVRPGDDRRRPIGFGPNRV